MKIWLLNASEQLPSVSRQRRPMRTGMMARALIERGHEVTWWKSTFEHVSKTHCRDGAGFEEVAPGLTVGWLHSRGYRRHVSLARALDHREVGKHFAKVAPSRPAPDVIVCSYPIPELALAGVRFANRRGIPVVLDIRDWWPDALTYTLPRVLRPVADVLLTPYARLGRAACRGATAITGITPAFVDWGLARAGRQRNGRDRDFPHGYDIPAVSETDAAAARAYWNELGVPDDKSRPTVVFIGSISRTFDFAPVLAAARLHGSSGDSAVFVLCGDGDRLQAVRGLAAGLSNVVFSGRWVGPAAIQELLRRATVGLVPLPDRPDFLATINNKTVEYLSAGLPIVVSPENSWVGHLAAEHGFGVCWNGRDARELAQVLAGLADDRECLVGMARRAGSYFRDHFDAGLVYPRFADYLEEVARRGVPRNRAEGTSTVRLWKSPGQHAGIACSEWRSTPVLSAGC